MNWGALIQAILGAEQAIIPIIIPHPTDKSGKIAAVILASEGAAAAILQGAGVVPPAPPTPPTP